MTEKALARRQALAGAGLLHPEPASITAPLFDAPAVFFLAEDKVQVKYEMLRAHAVDGLSAAAAARTHGYSRGGFYVVQAAFEAGGVPGLVDERRGRRGPLKLTPEILAFLEAHGERPGTALAAEIEARFGVRLHRRTLERARRR